MENNFNEFMRAFNELDKEQSVSLVFNWLSNQEITIKELYEEILVKALANLTDIESNPQHKIWFEHVQSSIVRTIIEMAHPFVLENKQPSLLKKAAVICPDNEQHELGARMINDYLTLAGVQSYFVGRDTPRNEFIKMIQEVQLNIVAISVTNYYNVSEVIKTIEKIIESKHEVTILLGGRAIANNPHIFNQYKNVVLLKSSEALFDWLKTVQS